MCNSHSISEANKSLDNNRVSVQASFCLREGFKDVDKSDPLSIHLMNFSMRGVS